MKTRFQSYWKIVLAVLPWAILCHQAALAQTTWKPAGDKMMTSWAKEVTPESAWSEYPRPQFVRSDWKNLNGLWSYSVTAKDAETPKEWSGKILVPFCPESALSGVGRLIEPTESLWYRRDLPSAVSNKRTILNFEAVDYNATVWVNGREVGKHRGGHTPFSFDITDSLKSSDNELVVKVNDATEAFQLHGKQNIDPKGIWYTRVTGIWQTVWIEQVSPAHLADVDYACDIKAGTLQIFPELCGGVSTTNRVRATASFKGQTVATGEGSSAIVLQLKEPQLWSPSTPNLYDVKLEVFGTDGQVTDSIQAYTAMREFGKIADASGHLRFTLNGKPFFHWGPLDQGWWPDGLLTPPTDKAMLSDIEFLKAAGFNMIRKHIKVEPRRYYYHCDRLGMLMWQDQVSNGTGKKRDQNHSPEWTRLKPDPVDANWPIEAQQQYILEYQRMVEHLRDAPCIASWVPFNEAWGQHATMEIGKLAVELDRSRAINIASGGNFWPIGDVADEHKYPDPGFPLEDVRFKSFIKVVGEFGGHGWPVKGHLWLETEKNWGYGGLPKSMDEWKERYQKSMRILNDLRKQGIAAGIYTQTTDVEVEVNGLRTYDRIDKIDPAWLKEQAAILFEDAK
ncbi:MAG: glycoside hydrolase family 2 TIM barrel-domain containing protein [Pirellulaceae bacterium]|nr:glycoside hydrolase family 2 TIM barrel-domain containing protein [Pirellulaceae bacterium]